MHRLTSQTSPFSVLGLLIFCVLMLGCMSSRRAGSVMDAALFFPDEIGYRIAQGDDVDAIHQRTFNYSSGSQSGQVDIGQTALSVAVRHGRTDAVKTLLAYGANPDLGEATVGYTPLAWASRAEDMEMVRALLDAGADPNLRYPTPYSSGEYPLVWAVRKNNPEMVRLLIAYGADVHVHVRDAEGLTCLQHAIEWRRDEVADVLREAGAE